MMSQTGKQIITKSQDVPISQMSQEVKTIR